MQIAFWASSGRSGSRAFPCRLPCEAPGTEQCAVSDADQWHLTSPWQLEENVFLYRLGDFAVLDQLSLLLLLLKVIAPFTIKQRRSQLRELVIRIASFCGPRGKGEQITVEPADCHIQMEIAPLWAGI